MEMSRLHSVNSMLGIYEKIQLNGINSKRSGYIIMHYLTFTLDFFFKQQQQQKSITKQVIVKMKFQKWIF